MAAETPTLSLREVAARAGVRASAVSNWRKRNVGFPQPVSSEGREERFDAAQVDKWLRATGRLEAGPVGQARLRLSRAEEAERARIGMALVALHRVAPANQRRQLLAAEPGTLLRVASALGRALEQDGAVPPGAFTASLDVHADPDRLRLRELLAEIGESPDRGAEVFESLAGVRAEAGGGHLDLSRSHSLLGLLMDRLLPAEAASVHDPAFGEASLLLKCAASRPGVELSGTELHVPAFVVGAQRLLAHGFKPDLRLGDALHDDPFGRQTFDAVVCEPPFGQKSTLSGELALTFPGAIGASPDMQWVVHSLLKLAPGGMALVAQPAGALTREGSDATLRSELIRRGHVLALMALPPGLSPASTGPPALWVLTGGSRGPRRDEVLFVDISWAPARSGPDELSLAREIIPDLVADVRSWHDEPKSFDGRPGMSAAIPILDLLGTNTSLSPQYWVGRADRLRSRDVWSTRRDDAWSWLESAQTELGAIEPAADLDEFVMDDPPNYVPLTTYADAGRLELIRGEPVDKSDLGPSGYPVLTAASFAEPGQPLSVTGHIRVPLRAVTEPGDVVFLPRGRAIRALVDRKGGHHVAAPLLVLRPTRGDQGMVAEVLAALLSSPRVQTLGTGSTLPSVTPRSVTLPRIDAASADAAGQYLSFLERLETAAFQLLRSIDEARETLVEGLETGARLGAKGTQEHSDA